MSLTWDVTECVDSERLTSEEGWEITQAMIFATMGVGIGHITKVNWPEFYARLVMAGYYGDDITPDLVVRYIGLRTNVFPEETRAKWMKRVLGLRMDDLAREARASLPATRAKVSP